MRGDLVEAKWERAKIPEADLLVFRGKIEGKSAFTRGVFIALNGISDPAQDAITRGKQANFFVVDGYDVMMVLQHAMPLPDFLRRRRRLLADEGLVVATFDRVVGSREHRFQKRRMPAHGGIRVLKDRLN